MEVVGDEAKAAGTRADPPAVRHDDGHGDTASAIALRKNRIRARVRLRNRLRLTRRLMLMTLGALAVFVAFFAVTLIFGEKLFITWIVFFCGIIGGFVSIQQRAPKIKDEELGLLVGSWFQILLIPVFGAVFALVLYCIFLSGLLNADIFPKFSFPRTPREGPDTEFIIKILRETYPASGPDLAKLIFWSFTAGFAERFVPQIISNLTSKAS